MNCVSAGVVTARQEQSVPVVRAYVVDALRQWGVRVGRLDDAALLVSELVGNAVRHGAGPRVAVHVTYELSTVRCRVYDDGEELPTPGPLYPDAPHLTPDLLAEDESGRGLVLVEAIASRWGAQRDEHQGWGTKVVWFELTE